MQWKRQITLQKRLRCNVSLWRLSLSFCNVVQRFYRNYMATSGQRWIATLQKGWNNVIVSTGYNIITPSSNEITPLPGHSLIPMPTNSISTQTQSTHVQDVLIRTNILVLVIRLQDVLPRRFQNVFKTSSRQDIFEVYSKRFWDVFQRRLSVKGFA